MFVDKGKAPINIDVSVHLEAYFMVLSILWNLLKKK